MEDHDARERLAILNAQLKGIVDVVARLVAYEAARWPNPNQIYQDFAEATALHTDAMSKRRKLTSGAIAFQEEAQKQVDWIVAAARMMELAGRGLYHQRGSSRWAEAGTGSRNVVASLPCRPSLLLQHRLRERRMLPNIFANTVGVTKCISGIPSTRRSDSTTISPGTNSAAGTVTNVRSRFIAA
jgi:hypothetical protein